MVDSDASVGGGAFPSARIPSVAVAVSRSGGGGAADIEQRLRGGDPAIIARVNDDRVLIDLRAVFPEEDELVIAALNGVLQ